ncbi:HAD family hydrolase [Motiliproteus sp. MSK22-1]|uniref:HAD family hydrolase n=1 Tax=Motiliproteus sp. MSK22-1 TaxID=1897630 RepID=UPI0009758E2B|nr:HAD family hydrolase [Motiliproteus sp. MSK22-1]OMH39521.1 HAD family hydrolase [Motiliproteus sp. MSK22-1]
MDALKTKGCLLAPSTLIFDWHGTLVDTLDAMFEAMEEMLPQLEDLDLVKHLLPEDLCRTSDDVKLVRYIRIFRRLHPKILAERRVSRTDIFNAIFGDDVEAKRLAHEAYNRCYRHYFGKVRPYQEGVGCYLETFKKLGLKLGIATNRSREFLDHELQVVDDGEWAGLIDTTACADGVPHYKPHPDVIHAALSAIDVKADANCWYVGDSYQDMVTAKNAGVSGIFYNGASWPEEYLNRLFAKDPACLPYAFVNSFDELVDLLEQMQQQDSQVFSANLAGIRPWHSPGPEAPAPRIEPDWHPATAQLQAPKAILFDWHATLVDTLDAMYHAVDDMLPELRDKGLLDRMVDPGSSKSLEDARLVEYVQSYCQLHPKVKVDRKISRTDIFEVLFGEDQEAKQLAHKIFNSHYRNHYGTVLPFEPQVKKMLQALNGLVKVGVITNRDREFFEHELAAVDGTGWAELFSCNICGDDTPLRKPHPDQLILAAQRLGMPVNEAIWYVGDSTTDIIAAQKAGVTAVFFNGAQWDLPWLGKIFPATERHPYKPDVVVNDFSEFWALVLACQEKQ